MEPISTKFVKRIEIIVPSIELKQVLTLLDRVGVPGYSILRNVIGKGDRGSITKEEELEMLGNDYILTICEAEQVPQVLTAVQPLLKRYGGICISSDAQWLIHENPLL